MMTTTTMTTTTQGEDWTQVKNKRAARVLDEGLRQLGAICDSLTAQLDREEGQAATRTRSDSKTTFPGPKGERKKARG